MYKSREAQNFCFLFLEISRKLNWLILMNCSSSCEAFLELFFLLCRIKSSSSDVFRSFTLTQIFQKPRELFLAQQSKSEKIFLIQTSYSDKHIFRKNPMVFIFFQEIWFLRENIMESWFSYQGLCSVWTKVASNKRIWYRLGKNFLQKVLKKVITKEDKNFKWKAFG